MLRKNRKIGLQESEEVICYVTEVDRQANEIIPILTIIPLTFFLHIYAYDLAVCSKLTYNYTHLVQ